MTAPSSEEREASARAARVFDDFFARRDGEDPARDSDFVADLVGRFEGPDWERDRLLQIPTAQANLARTIFFDGVFGNGGLSYWISYDEPTHGGHAMVRAFREIDMPAIADALEAIHAEFPLGASFADQEWRMARLAELEARLAPLEREIWQHHDAIAERQARYVRARREEFAELRTRRSWCSILEEYEDYSDAEDGED